MRERGDALRVRRPREDLDVRRERLCVGEDVLGEEGRVGRSDGLDDDELRFKKVNDRSGKGRGEDARFG